MDTYLSNSASATAEDAEASSLKSAPKRTMMSVIDELPRMSFTAKNHDDQRKQIARSIPRTLAQYGIKCFDSDGKPGFELDGACIVPNQPRFSGWFGLKYDVLITYTDKEGREKQREEEVTDRVINAVYHLRPSELWPPESPLPPLRHPVLDPDVWKDARAEATSLGLLRMLVQALNLDRSCPDFTKWKFVGAGGRDYRSALAWRDIWPVLFAPGGPERCMAEADEMILSYSCETENDRANLASFCFTPWVRPAFSVAPIFFFNGMTSNNGTLGKSEAVSAMQIATCGKTDTWNESTSPNETNWGFAGFALESGGLPAVVPNDNVPTESRWDPQWIYAFSTSQGAYSGFRKPQVGNVPVYQRCVTLTANGNRITFAPEAAKRVVSTNLVARGDNIQEKSPSEKMAEDHDYKLRITLGLWLNLIKHHGPPDTAPINPRLRSWREVCGIAAERWISRLCGKQVHVRQPVVGGEYHEELAQLIAQVGLYSPRRAGKLAKMAEDYPTVADWFGTTRRAANAAAEVGRKLKQWYEEGDVRAGYRVEPAKAERGADGWQFVPAPSGGKRKGAPPRGQPVAEVDDVA
jgi:hypothetical protein